MSSSTPTPGDLRRVGEVAVAHAAKHPERSAQEIAHLAALSIGPPAHHVAALEDAAMDALSQPIRHSVRRREPEPRDLTLAAIFFRMGWSGHVERTDQEIFDAAGELMVELVALREELEEELAEEPPVAYWMVVNAGLASEHRYPGDGWLEDTMEPSGTLIQSDEDALEVARSVGASEGWTSVIVYRRTSDGMNVAIS